MNLSSSSKTTLCFLLLVSFCILKVSAQAPILPAAERVSSYIPLLKGKRVAVYANNTSLSVNNKHLVDVLLENKIRVVKIFAPEHGFRGEAYAGEKVSDTKDSKTGLPIVSLYGKKRRPSPQDLKDVDLLLFDIQDIGARYYTYISSLEEYILAAVEADKPLIVLDRPNPNGFYVDGPILEKPYRTFIGMQPVPAVYGMTIGEYGKMLIGEKWLDSTIMKKRKKNFSYRVVPCGNYTHQSKYTLPVNPSPNIPDMASVYWFPSICFFEGTVLSEGRGTDKAFQVFGHPAYPKTLYSFTPQTRPGSGPPKLAGQVCYGWYIGDTPEKVLKAVNGRLQLGWLIQAYKMFPDKSAFFLKPDAKAPAYALSSGKGSGEPLPTEWFFNKLAGNSKLMAQIKAGLSEDEIRKSWEPGLKKFKAIRKKYLIYP